VATRKKTAKKKSPRKTRPRTKSRSDSSSGEHQGRSRSLWSGSISFGLLNIPVSIVSAKQEAGISFDLLDKRDHARIGYRQYNKSTGKEVSRGEIVKGYQLGSGKYVIVSDQDFQRANPKAVSSVDIEDFVNLEDLSPMLFENPYYLCPQKGGEKGYALLRDVMRKTKKVAVGKVVLFRRQHLVAILPAGDYLVIELLRFDREIRTPDEMEGLKETLGRVKLTDKEIQMAESLLEGMTTKWDHSRYADTYEDDLLKRIHAKARKGTLVDAVEPDESESSEEAHPSKVVDLMPLLKKSLEAGKRKRTRENAETG